MPTPQQAPQREKLDLETSEERQARLGNLLSSILPSKAVEEVQLPRGPLRTYEVPQSDALARAKAFLPLLQQSNQTLLTKAALSPESVNIENVEGQERVIQMDLGLGVYGVDGESQRGNGQKGLGEEIVIPEEVLRRAEEADSEEQEERDGEEVGMTEEQEEMSDSESESGGSDTTTSESEEEAPMVPIESATIP